MNNLTFTATEARKNLFEILEKLNNPAVKITINYKGHPRAVMLNSEEFDSHEETLQILADKKLVREIKEAEKQFKHGEYKTFEEVFNCSPRDCI